MRDLIFTGVRWVALLMLIYVALFALPAMAKDETDPDGERPLEAPPGIIFTDVTAVAGIDTVYTLFSDYRVTGQAWGDYNGDGWLDLYVTGGAGDNTLYRNNGGGTFSVSPLSDSVAMPGVVSGGAVFADYNNDGWPDLYVLTNGANVLFRNDSGTGFTDVTDTAGVGDTGNGRTASWGDYDNDGHLDLYIANWSCAPQCGRPREGDRDRLYHNNGDGTFTDATTYLGAKTRGAGFAASFVDYDNDGDLDIYLVNDEFINPIGNVLWRNDGPGCGHWCFTEVSAEARANTRLMGMGLAIADYNNNGNLDFYFSNAGPMVLLQNQGDGTFINSAETAGVALDRGSIGWGAVFLDFDNDGWQDLYLAISNMLDQNAANQLFQNNGDGTFTNRTTDSGVGHPGRTMGIAYADFDNDGWVDLIVGNLNQGYTLYRNEGFVGQGNRWLAINLVGDGVTINRDAVGARVYVTTEDGNRQMQEVKIGSSLGSGNALTLHFGLGQTAVTELTIVWSDGLSQEIEGIEPDQYYTFTYADRDAEPEADASSLLSGDAGQTVSGRSTTWLIGLLPLLMLGGFMTYYWYGRRRKRDTVIE